MNRSLQQLRKDASAIFQAGIAAADPFNAVTRCLSFREQQLHIMLNADAPDCQRTAAWHNIHIIAFGKAAVAMARAAQQTIPAGRIASCIVVTHSLNDNPLEHAECYLAGHPLPDRNGLNAAQRVIDQLQAAQAGELVLVLVSGGGSALLPAPVDGLNLSDKIATTELLLSCGATINEINCVRKHLSRLKGGGMARLSAPADLHALILSDVLGDDLSAIASGPTVADNTEFKDAIAILQNRSVWNKIPDPVRYHLENGLIGKFRETPKPGDPVFAHTGHTLIGSNRLSVDAAIQKAEGLGYESRLYSDHLCGEARDEAAKLVEISRQLQQSIRHPTALIAGGETTVTLKGRGQGGRNQEMALAFAAAAWSQRLEQNWLFLSGGTDGRDGPTDAAGGLVDPGTLLRIDNPLSMLNNNDSYNALKQAQDLLITGATGTNVADLQVLLIQPLS